MHFARAQRLLEPGYTAFETGHRRLRDGTVLVAGLTSMPGVRAEMVHWWFADFMRTTEHYRWWHPRDHVWMDWEDKRPGEIVGASHLVHEYIGGALQKLRIRFVDPEGFFRGGLGAFDGLALCAQAGPLDRPVTFTRMCHVVRDTEWGCEMRSRFWLGVVDAGEGAFAGARWLRPLVNNPLARALLVPRRLPAGLQKHCAEEMSYLAGFLPELYRREHGGERT